MMNAGLTNSSTGGDPAVQSHLCATDAEPALNATVAETVAPEANIASNSDPNFDPKTDPNSDPNSDSWRVEVAARLERYRMRRKPRTPRYPSLLLPFDAPESWSRPAPLIDSVAAGTLACAEPRQGSQHSSQQGQEEQGPYRYPDQVAQQSAKG